jgi:hypothetical protein
MRYAMLLILLAGMACFTPTFADDADNGTTAVRKVRIEGLEFSENSFDWRHDWWKYLLVVLGGTLSLFLALRITRMLLRLILFAACIAIGAVGAMLVSPWLTPYVVAMLPRSVFEKFPPSVFSYSLAFLITYFIALTVMRLMHRPVVKESKDKDSMP